MRRYTPLLISILLCIPVLSQATVYLDLDNETYPIDQVAPMPPYLPYDGTIPSLVVRDGSQGCGGRTPSGNKFLKQHVPDGSGPGDESGYHEIRNTVPTVTNLEGRILYLAWFSCVERVGGRDVWHDINTEN